MAVFCFCDSAHAIPVKAITWGEEEEGAIGEPSGKPFHGARSQDQDVRVESSTGARRDRAATRYVDLWAYM
jgi:hypothetical protein